jgi:hypothetical protein
LADTPDESHAEAERGREQTEAGGGDDSLQDLSRDERDYARERMKNELGREPTDEEVDEWLRRHTEGY